MEGLLIVMALLLSKTCYGARILILQPTPAKGHAIVMEPLFEELAARGHEVTLLTSFPRKTSLPNLKEIDMSSRFPSLVSNFSLEQIRESMPNQLMSPLFMEEIEHHICEEIYSDARTRAILESNDTYDLVMTEIFTNDCFVPFAHKFNASLVSFVTSFAVPWMSDRVGLPDNPAYIPNYFVDVSNEMNLYERIYNTGFLVYSKLLYNYYIVPKTQKLVNSFIGSSVPPITEIIKNTSLVLVNSYFSLSHSRPLPPNVVEMGGIHLRNSTNKMPKDLKDILDRSFQGVLVVSFGSMVRVSSLPQYVIRNFMNVFSKIPHTVIFKYEEDLPQVPTNVVLRRWLPQREILEHNNVKAAVIHGGLASTMEAVYFGKPIVGVPFFSDQFLNIKTVARQGMGLILDLDHMSEENIGAAIHQVLNNPKYTENAKRLSLQFRDRSQTALESAVFWTEYVMRHKGAPHLRPAAVDLTIFQYLFLDVLAFLLTPLILLLAIYFYFF